VADPDPETKLRELLAEVERHRSAVREFRQSAYPEMVALHELRLLALYSQIRRHCRENRLPLPPQFPRE